jgi:T5SS/PEP-CTERM-associated repeat protein
VLLSIGGLSALLFKRERGDRMGRSKLFPPVFFTALSLVCSLSPAHAAFTPLGDVVPAIPPVWTSSTTGYVGKTSAGTLTVNAGSDLLSYYGYIGYGSSTTGTVNITGNGSTWTNGYSLYIGNSGSGALNVTNGGIVDNTSGYGYIGYESGSTGVVTVSGTNSKWNLNSTYNGLYVGNSGSGTLSITNGGVVTSGNYSDAYVGYNDGSTGIATVSGANSNWDMGDDLYVGYSGNGTLLVTGAGTVGNNSGCGYIGYTSGSTGEVTISDTNSNWSVHDTLYIGRSGGGTLSILSGGRVSSSNYNYVGYNSGSTGKVTVDGANSQWYTGYDLCVGNSGSGELDVTNGGAVSSSKYSYIGYNGISSGTVSVDGTNSKWYIGDDIYVGYSGNGTLSITNGGNVSSSSSFVDRYIGGNNGSSGVVTVDGTGSKWSDDNGTLYVGYSGSGRVERWRGGVGFDIVCFGVSPAVSQ